MSGKKKVSTARFLNAKITSTISISLVLVLLGITILILFMGNGLSRFVKENMSFNVMLSTEVNDAENYPHSEKLRRATICPLLPLY